MGNTEHVGCMMYETWHCIGHQLIITCRLMLTGRFAELCIYNVWLVWTPYLAVISRAIEPTIR